MGRDQEIARILELKSRGVITDAQAIDIINALVAEGPIAPAPAPAPASAAKAPEVPAAASAASASSAPAPVSAAVAAPVAVIDSRYAPVVALEGRLRSIGSDTMDLLVASWEKEFVKYHPKLRIIHEGRGSSTATPALVGNLSDVGPMSRAMLEAERVKFRERFGYDATEVRTAIDALGVYVHPENPLAKSGLTLTQLDAIFSSTRKRGGGEQLTTWGQLGLGGEWANAPIRVYGRNRASGTYGYFRDSALAKGEFGAWVEEQPSSAVVVQKIEGDKFGIGFSGVGYRTPGVAMLALAKTDDATPVQPSEETALNGTYPLARPLFLTLNHNPAGPMTDLQREFLTFVLGPVGQEVVQKEGYYPLPPAILAEEVAKLR
jgi:phosphate transport system substrate-binding protein